MIEKMLGSESEVRWSLREKRNQSFSNDKH